MNPAEYLSVFEFFDRDKSGYISPSELKEAIGACGQKISDLDLRTAISDVGLNGEEISYEHFAKFIQHLESRVLSFTDVDQLFKSLDVDGSGYLTAAEIRHFMTNMNLCENDATVDEMISLYDLDGNGEITLEELLTCLKNLGYSIEEGVDDMLKSKVNYRTSSPTKTPETALKIVQSSKMYSVHDFPEEAREAMSMFDFLSDDHVSEDDLRRAAELLKIEKLKSVRDPEANPGLHWTPGRKKSGLGNLIYKANHIAIIVSDVGRSASFYTNIMGFQQIRRPDFDRHGAWFTMGSLELHLIKGTPVVHTADDLVVGHISIETFDIDKVPTVLRELGVPFRQNVSVPSTVGAHETNTSNTNNKTVRQYFIRDPDGYYIEICNCDVLTSFCLGGKEDLVGYEEGVRALTAENAARVISFMHKWTGKGQQSHQYRESLVEEARGTDGSIEAYAKLLGYEIADEIDEDKLRNLTVRRSVYGDICQNESEEELKQILLSCGNDVPKADCLMKLRAEVHGSRKVRAPVFYNDGETMVCPREKPLHDGL
ncbi:Dihydroxybiphenyl dioxygenase [Gracilaria domingensis]|nr:Dihydroxybiphenyl dioxygenase [Gracilaria domingensis]